MYHTFVAEPAAPIMRACMAPNPGEPMPVLCVISDEKPATPIQPSLEVGKLQVWVGPHGGSGVALGVIVGVLVTSGVGVTVGVLVGVGPQSVDRYEMKRSGRSSCGGSKAE